MCRQVLTQHSRGFGSLHSCGRAEGELHVLIEELKQYPGQFKMSFGILAEQLGLHTDASTISERQHWQYPLHVAFEIAAFIEYLVCLVLKDTDSDLVGHVCSTQPL